MTTTIDELVRVFEVAFYGAANGPADKANFRAGIRAVVEALRDAYTSVGYRMMTIHHFDEILASDGVGLHPTTGNPVGTDTIAGRHPASDDYLREKMTSGAATAATVFGERPVPAVAPVCEWTLRGQWWHLSCGNGTHFDNATARRGLTHCPPCGKPIKLTEAAR